MSIAATPRHTLYGEDLAHAAGEGPAPLSAAWVTGRGLAIATDNLGRAKVSATGPDHNVEDDPGLALLAEPHERLPRHAPESPYCASKLRLIPEHLLPHIFIWLMPTIRYDPKHQYWHLDESGTYTFYNALFVCRRWYFAAFDFPHLWGSLMPRARSQRWWNWMYNLARSAQVRIAYSHGLEVPTLNHALPTACTVQVGLESPWHHWGVEFSGLSMPAVEVLYIRPRNDRIRRYMTVDGLLEMRARPLIAPCLREAVLACPLLLDSPRLYRLDLSNFSAPQLAAALSRQTCLQHLEIHSPCVVSGDQIAWTEVLRLLGSSAYLRELRIWTRAWVNAPLAPTTTPVFMPSLRSLDICGSIAVVAPLVETIEAQKLTAVELMTMLSRARSVRSLSVSSLWDQPDSTPHSPAAELLELKSLKVGGDINPGWTCFFCGIRAPSLRRAEISFPSTTPPNHKVFPLLQRDLTRARNAPGVTAPVLAAALYKVFTALCDSGHGAMARALDPFPEGAPAPHHCIYASPGPMPPLDVLMQRAAQTASALSDAALQPPPQHSGHLLRQAIRSIVSSLGVGASDSFGTLIIEYKRSQLSFRALLQRDGEAARTILTTTRDPCEGRAAQYDPLKRPDSRAHCTSRVLLGLRDVPIHTIRVVNDGHDPCAPLEGLQEDITDLASSLAMYSAVETAVFQLNTPHASAGMLRALSLPHALPGLGCIVIRSATILAHVEETASPAPHQPLWPALLDVLRARAALNRKVHRVVLDGALFVCEEWLQLAEPLVGRVELRAVKIVDPAD